MRGFWGKETYPFHRVDNTSDDFAVENRTSDKIYLYLDAVNRVLPNIATSVYELTQMCLMIFLRDKANEMCPIAHFV